MALPNHNELVGRHRLFNVVSCLGQSCPWTRSIKAHEMLHFLKSEADELNHEIDLMNSDEVGLNDLNNTRGCYVDRKKAMISELGDILFDVLMLEMIMRRDYGISTDEAWQAAAEKIERRTPYMKEWGDGISNANTVEDAERIWKAAKEKEADKLDKANKYSSNFVSKRSFDLVCIKGRYVWSHIKCHGKLLVGAVFGYLFSHFWSDCR